MISIITFTVHKSVRGISWITTTDKGRFRNQIRRVSKQPKAEVDFKPIQGVADHTLCCTITFDGDIDVPAAREILKKTGLMCYEFGDFRRDVPMAVAGP